MHRIRLLRARFSAHFPAISSSLLCMTFTRSQRPAAMQAAAAWPHQSSRCVARYLRVRLSALAGVRALCKECFDPFHYFIVSFALYAVFLQLTLRSIAGRSCMMEPVTKRLPLSMTVGAVKQLAGRLFKAPDLRAVQLSYQEAGVS